MITISTLTQRTIYEYWKEGGVSFHGGGLTYHGEGHNGGGLFYPNPFLEIPKKIRAYHSFLVLAN